MQKVCPPSPARSALTIAALGVLAALTLGPAATRADGPDDPSTQPATAVDAITRAEALIRCDSPASSNLMYDDTPPYPPAWHVMAAQAWEQNATARAAFREAATQPSGHWPPSTDAYGNTNRTVPSLVRSRRLANELGDVAVFAVFNGHQNEALNLIDDLGRLADLMDLDADAEDGEIRLLVGLGIDALRTHRLRLVSTMLDLSPTAADPVSARRLSALIDTLLRHPTADAAWDKFGKVRRAKETAATQPDGQAARDVAKARERLILALNRIYADRAMMAVGLACLLYRQDTGHWPDTADTLMPKYLAALPTDPFADPPAPVGYRLVKGGLPDGADRPLVFSVEDSGNGLSFAENNSLYGRYIGNGDTSIGAQRGMNHGQFRDVAPWPPRQSSARTRVTYPAATVLYSRPCRLRTQHGLVYKTVAPGLNASKSAGNL